LIAVGPIFQGFMNERLADWSCLIRTHIPEFGSKFGSKKTAGVTGGSLVFCQRSTPTAILRPVNSARLTSHEFLDLLRSSSVFLNVTAGPQPAPRHRPE
jgi:hypothetical protein